MSKILCTHARPSPWLQRTRSRPESHHQRVARCHLCERGESGEVGKTEIGDSVVAEEGELIKDFESGI